VLDEEFLNRRSGNVVEQPLGIVIYNAWQGSCYRKCSYVHTAEDDNGAGIKLILRLILN